MERNSLTYSRHIKVFIMFSCFLMGVFLVGTPGENLSQFNFCLVKGLMGIPCPACGVTHSVYETLTLNIKKALKYNPAGPLVAILLIVNWFYYLLAVATDRFQLSLGKEKMVLFAENWVLVGSLMSVWMIKLLKI